MYIKCYIRQQHTTRGYIILIPLWCNHVSLTTQIILTLILYSLKKPNCFDWGSKISHFGRKHSASHSHYQAEQNTEKKNAICPLTINSSSFLEPVTCPRCELVTQVEVWTPRHSCNTCEESSIPAGNDQGSSLSCCWLPVLCKAVAPSEVAASLSQISESNALSSLFISVLMQEGKLQLPAGNWSRRQISNPWKQLCFTQLHH